MVNLLGDLWEPGTPDWSSVMRRTGVALHLYGKKHARPGRKMGHLTVVADSAAAARSQAMEARRALSGQSVGAANDPDNPATRSTPNGPGGLRQAY